LDEQLCFTLLEFRESAVSLVDLVVECDGVRAVGDTGSCQPPTEIVF